MIASVAVTIRRAKTDDAGAIWAIIEPAIRDGETLALARDIDKAGALSTYWMRLDNDVFVAAIDGEIVGSYFLRANQSGGADHVCNAGYATAPAASGKGVARQMCEQSLAIAKDNGFLAMQYNCVVSSNAGAVHLWQSCGFDIAGTLRLAFHHPVLGFVDALIMHVRYRGYNAPFAKSRQPACPTDRFCAICCCRYSCRPHYHCRGISRSTQARL